MRFLRFDSVGGASGDMILGALVRLGVAPEVIEREIRKLIPNEAFSFKIKEKSEFGVSGIYLTVELDDGHGHCHKHGHDHTHEDEHCGHDGANHEHHDPNHNHGHVHGRTWASIREMLEHSSLEEKTKRDSLAAFGALAEAEAEAHSRPVDDVHFHEVGAVDSIIDTVGCVLALNTLGVDGISISPLPVGEGTFRCAHGIYPLPAPAVAILLRKYGLPVSHDVEKCEMLTPTAASLFAIWNKVAIPSGAKIVASANSFGTRKMENRPNLLRVSLYETEGADSGYDVETLYELETNIDDASGERLASTASALFKAGALDVWFEPIQMKKGRPASRLCVLVKESERETALDVIFRHSGSFGVRESVKRRYFLTRRFENVETKYGKARVKIGMTKSGEIVSVSPEFEDCAALAAASSTTFEAVYREVLRLCVEK